MKTLLAFGLGYSATALASRLKEEGWAIIGTGRTPQSLARIAASGFLPLAFDGENANPDVSEAIAAATHILVSIAPNGRGDPVLECFGDDLAEAPALEWCGYLSTIGVYGDHGGAWVDEATPPQPLSARSRERVAAEEAWIAFARRAGKIAQIFRLSGIYGPGRNALEKLLRGDRQNIHKPGQVFNRIHVEDIAATLFAAIERVRDGDPALLFDPVFNVTDDEPAPPQDVIAFAARLLGMEPPPLIPIEQADLSLMALSFYGENKRVRNARIKRDLGVRLAYPTYREGLSALRDAMELADARAAGLAGAAG